MSLEDMEFDKLIREMLTWSKEKEAEKLRRGSIISVPDEERHRAVGAVISGLIRAAKEAGAEYEIDYGGPSSKRAGVSITARKINFISPYGFGFLAAVADNFEIYPLTDGNLRLDAMFYHLRREIQIRNGDYDQ